jgi:hypothetical protein
MDFSSNDGDNELEQSVRASAAIMFRFGTSKWVQARLLDKGVPNGELPQTPSMLRNCAMPPVGSVLQIRQSSTHSLQNLLLRALAEDAKNTEGTLTL